MTRTAVTKNRFGRTKWKCPCCDTTLGEVYPDRVVVKIGGRVITFGHGEHVKQICAQCGTESTLVAEETAA